MKNYTYREVPLDQGCHLVQGYQAYQGVLVYQWHQCFHCGQDFQRAQLDPEVLQVQVSLDCPVGQRVLQKLQLGPVNDLQPF